MGTTEFQSETLRHSRLSEYLSWIGTACSGNGWVFRGQADNAWHLYPSVSRPNPKVDPAEAQRVVLSELKLRLSSVYDGNLSDDWEILALAQHHGAPTALLDWSRSPLTALWFAVSERARLDNVCDAAVWAFQTTEADFVSEGERKGSPLDVHATRFFEVRHFDRRLASQQGLFSIHKWWEQGGKVVPLDGNVKLRGRLKKLTVPREHIVPLLKELDAVGVNAASIFPDLEGLCKHALIKHRLEPSHIHLSVRDTVSISASASAGLSVKKSEIM